MGTRQRVPEILKIMVSEKQLKIIVGVLEDACQETFGRPLREYLNRSHKPRYADVRQMSVRLLYDYAQMTFKEIADYMGQHYTTAIYGYYKSGDMLRIDKSYRDIFHKYENTFKNSLCEKSVL